MAETSIPIKREILEAIVYTNLSGREFGQGAEVKVYFMPDAAAVPGYQPYTATQVAADPTLASINASYIGIAPSKYQVIMDNVFGMWAKQANISFVRTSNPAEAQIRVGAGDWKGEGNSVNVPGIDGDRINSVFIRPDYYLRLGAPADFLVGSKETHDLMHEVGHAIGLNHPALPQEGGTLSADFNNMPFTVMTNYIKAAGYGQGTKLAPRKRISTLCRAFIATCSIAMACPPAIASDLRAGSMCEGAWGDGYISPLPQEQTQQQRALAEKGDAQAQFFMGVATADKAESNQWLQRAIAGGSKGAAAYYTYKRDPRLASQNDVEQWNRKDPQRSYSCWWPIAGLTEEEQTDLLTPIIAAAEAGEPQPATWLWQMVVGETRVGGTYNRNCKTNHPLLKASDTRKWMEIAGRGGNPWAQEEVCSAFSRTVSPQNVRVPDPQWGFTPDPSQAFYWCAIAAQNFCATRSVAALSSLYRKGIGVEKSESIADYWQGRRDQNSSPAQRTTRVIRQPILPLR